MDFRPLSRYRWLSTAYAVLEESHIDKLFPAPLEVWVGSYTAEVLAEMTAKGSFPAPREVWVGSYSEHYREGIQWKVSVPSRGMGGFPQYYKRSKIP